MSTAKYSYYSDHGCTSRQKLKDKLVVSSQVLQDRRFVSITTTLVKPMVATTPPPHTIPFSNLDRVFGFYYTPLILYYQNLNHASFSQVLQRLKSSLSRVLVMFYPLAGRVIIQSTSEPHAEIDCNDAGAVFTEAIVEARLEELRMDGVFFPAPVLSGIAAANIGPPGAVVFLPTASGLPVLIIQVTQFLCGGYSVAINWIHKVADAFSGTRFAEAWARCSRELDSTVFTQVQLPVFDRSMLLPRSPPNPRIDVTPSVHISELLIKEAAAGRELHESRAAGQQLACCWIQEFSSQALQKLKTEATKDGDGPFSVGDCMSAHLWKCLTRARSLAPEEVTSFLLYVEGRKKISPPLAEEYFGNVLFAQRIYATVADLLSKPLSFGAGLIRKAIQATTDESYRSLIDWVELQPASADILFMGSGMDFRRRDFSMLSWANFGVYEIDFGWQKPDFAVRNADSSEYLNGVSHLLPSPAGKQQRTLVIYLQPNILATLLEDPEFSLL